MGNSVAFALSLDGGSEGGREVVVGPRAARVEIILQFVRTLTAQPRAARGRLGRGLARVPLLCSYLVAFVFSNSEKNSDNKRLAPSN